jgi:hypothetical protein
MTVLFSFSLLISGVSLVGVGVLSTGRSVGMDGYITPLQTGWLVADSWARKSGLLHFCYLYTIVEIEDIRAMALLWDLRERSFACFVPQVSSYLGMLHASRATDLRSTGMDIPRLSYGFSRGGTVPG